MRAFHFIQVLTVCCLISCTSQKKQGSITSAGDHPNWIIASGLIAPSQELVSREFTFTENSHAKIRVLCSEQEGCRENVVKQIRISKIEAFPISFAISADESTGTLAELFDGNRTYLLFAEVHSDSGDELVPGDYVTEVPISLNEPTEGIDVRVSEVLE